MLAGVLQAMKVQVDTAIQVWYLTKRQFSMQLLFLSYRLVILLPLGGYYFLEIRKLQVPLYLVAQPLSSPFIAYYMT